MTAQHCPHCHTALPETASFCGACGRRIEGWSNLPQSAEGDGAEALPGSHEMTRQMEPTPSLLRVAALSREKRKRAAEPPRPSPSPDGARKGEPPRPSPSPDGASKDEPVESESMMLRAIRGRRAPLWIAMLLVASAGGVGGFLLMKQHRRAHAPPIAPAPELAEAPPPATAPAPTVTPPVTVAPSPAAPPPAAPSPLAPSPLAKTMTTKAKHPRAHRLTPLEVPVAQKHVKLPKGNGLPHKAVSTDSRAALDVSTRQKQPPPMQSEPQVQDPYASTPAPARAPQQLAMPSVQHEDPAGDGEPAPSAADQKREAEARIDADGVRFVVKQHLPQVHACYSRAFKDSSPGGRIEVGFAINSGGRAENVRTEVNTTDSAELAHCLEGRLREWQFPRPVGGDYELIYPFVFAPGS